MYNNNSKYIFICQRFALYNFFSFYSPILLKIRYLRDSRQWPIRLYIRIYIHTAHRYHFPEIRDLLSVCGLWRRKHLPKAKSAFGKCLLSLV